MIGPRLESLDISSSRYCVTVSGPYGGVFVNNATCPHDAFLCYVDQLQHGSVLPRDEISEVRLEAELTPPTRVSTLMNLWCADFLLLDDLVFANIVALPDSNRAMHVRLLSLVFYRNMSSSVLQLNSGLAPVDSFPEIGLEQVAKTLELATDVVIECARCISMISSQGHAVVSSIEFAPSAVAFAIPTLCH
jgi:hypothetical protein